MQLSYISHLNLTWAMFEDKIPWPLGITCLHKCTSVVTWLQTHAGYTACFFHISCCMSKTTQPLALFCLWQCNGQISNPVQDWRTNAMSGVCTMYIPFVFEFNVFMRLWRAKPYFPENCFKNQQMSPWWYLRARFYNHRDFIISSIANFTVRFCLRQFSS